MSKQTRPDDETRAAERDEADTPSRADRPPTEGEERAAEQHGVLDDDVIEHEREMAERGARQRGEGRIP